MHNQSYYPNWSEMSKKKCFPPVHKVLGMLFFPTPLKVFHFFLALFFKIYSENQKRLE